jgi:hypothetical protein
LLVVQILNIQSCKWVIDVKDSSWPSSEADRDVSILPSNGGSMSASGSVHCK